MSKADSAAVGQDTRRARAMQERLGYKVTCISLYQRDLVDLDRMVEALRARGLRRANRSMLIRYALRLVSVDTVTEETLYPRSPL